MMSVVEVVSLLERVASLLGEGKGAKRVSFSPKPFQSRVCSFGTQEQGAMHSIMQHACG